MINKLEAARLRLHYFSQDKKGQGGAGARTQRELWLEERAVFQELWLELEEGSLARRKLRK